MAVHETSLQVGHSLAEIDRAASWLDAFAATSDIPADTTSKLQVVLDEVLSNIIRHGGPGHTPILLELRRGEQDVELAVTDDGPPFDPRDVEPVAVQTRIAERRLGGAGLSFVRALVDEIDLVRRDGRNRLALRKHLPTATIGS